MRSAKRNVEQGIVGDILAAAVKTGDELDIINHTEWCNYFYTPLDLDIAYRTKEARLIQFYAEIRARLKDCDAFIVMDVNVFHPDFLESLNVYTALYSFDDPDGSYLRSMPYAYAFDHVFTVTPRYNLNTAMTDQFVKWGAKRSTYLPLGAIRSQFASLDEDLVFSYKKIHDIVFVGSATTVQRNEKLLRLKKYFGKRFELYGQWGWRTNLKYTLEKKRMIWVKPHTDLINLYLGARIGINVHDSDEYGFGNRRTFEIPLNGAMLICDYKKDILPTIYKLEEEAAGFDTIEECIERAEYFLAHDDEREYIARHGFRKVKEKFLFENIFTECLTEIKSYIK